MNSPVHAMRAIQGAQPDHAPARGARARPIRANGLLLAAAAAACAPLPAAATVQFRYAGDVGVSSAGDDAEVRFSSSRGDSPNAEASVSSASASVRAEFQPVALVTGQALSQGTNSGAGGSITLSYSVVFTPSNASSVQLAGTWAASGAPFGSVTGMLETVADGQAFAHAYARSEDGGFGAGEARVNDTFRQECGRPFAIVEPGAVGCGLRTFALGLHLKALPGSDSFVGSVVLWTRFDTSGGSEPGVDLLSTARAFVDPLITLDSRLSGDLVIGGGEIANAVPEPGTWALWAAGLAAMAGAARRRRV